MTSSTHEQLQGVFMPLRRVRLCSRLRSRGMEFRLFYDALKDLDLIWKWNERQELTRDSAKHGREMLKPRKTLMHNVLEMWANDIL